MRHAISNVLVPTVPETARETMSTSPDQLRSYKPTIEEIEKLVRRARGRVFFIRAGNFAESPNQTGANQGMVRGKDISANIKVSKRQALKYLESACSYTRGDGYMLNITISERCFFIG